MTEGFVSTLDIDVRFADTDQMGVVHHGVYILWMEMGRIAWLREAGLAYAEIARQGYNFAVVDVSCRYRLPIRFGERVWIRSRVTSLRSRKISFAYEIRKDPDGRRCALGESHHICVDKDNRMTTIPEWVMSRLKSFTERATTGRVEVGG